MIRNKLATFIMFSWIVLMVIWIIINLSMAIIWILMMIFAALLIDEEYEYKIWKEKHNL